MIQFVFLLKVWDLGWGSSFFFFLPTNVHLLQHHLLKSLSFLPWLAYAPRLAIDCADRFLGSLFCYIVLWAHPTSTALSWCLQLCSKPQCWIKWFFLIYSSLPGMFRLFYGLSFPCKFYLFIYLPACLLTLIIPRLVWALSILELAFVCLQNTLLEFW